MNCKNNIRFKQKRRGIALVITLIFVMVFSALSVAMFTMSVTSVQASENHQDSNHALNAALSGLELAKYLATTAGSVDVVLDYTAYKDGDFSTQANAIWTNLTNSEQLPYSGTDGEGLTYAESGAVTYNSSGATFNVRFTRVDDDTIQVTCTGANDGIQRSIAMTFNIEKQDDEILNYGLVGRGRMWITGDTTIHGDIYSSWDNPSVAPFNMTDDSTVLGTINTILGKDTMEDYG
jgi:Tfp pilus assembly protein PilX